MVLKNAGREITIMLWRGSTSTRGPAVTCHPHFLEGLVAGGVHECHGALRQLHTKGPDGLRDAPDLPLGDVGVAEPVQDGGLAVVDVPVPGEEMRRTDVVP